MEARPRAGLGLLVGRGRRQHVSTAGMEIRGADEKVSVLRKHRAGLPYTYQCGEDKVIILCHHSHGKSLHDSERERERGRGQERERERECEIERQRGKREGGGGEEIK